LAVLRLLPRTATVGGQILLDGNDVAAMSWVSCGRCGGLVRRLVFQGAMHALNPVRRVADRSPSRSCCTHARDVDARVRQLLERVGLPARGRGRIRMSCPVATAAGD